MIFEDRIQENPRLLRLKDPRTNEIVDFEIQDLLPEEIVQEGTEIDAASLNPSVIAETGSNERGSWIKFGDGTMITRQTYTSVVQSAGWSSWGNVYYATFSTPPNYPATFIETPVVAKSLGNQGGNAWIYYLESDTINRSGQLGAIRPTTPGAAITFTINVIAIGRWK